MTHRMSRREASYLVPVLITATFGVVGASRLSLWRDEFATILFAQLTLPEFSRALGHVDLVLAPYYLLGHVVTTAGVHGTGLRTLSVLAAVGSVVAVVWLGRRWWGALGGFVSGLVLALNPLFVELSIYARPYALATFLTLLSTALLVRSLERGAGSRRSAGAWISYSSCLVLAGAMHLFAVLVVPAQAALLLKRPPEVVRRFILAVCVAAAVLLPLVAAVGPQRSQVSWIPRPDAVRAAGVLFNIADYQAGGEVGVGAVLAAASCAAALVAVVVGLRAGAGGMPGLPRRPVTFCAALVLGPWLVLTIVSVLAFPVLTSHYLVISCPGVGLLFGAAATSALRHLRTVESSAPLLSVTTATACGLMVIVTGSAAVSFLRDHPRQDDFPELAKALQSRVGTGDIVLVVQGHQETGFAAGVAHYTNDEQHVRDVLQRLPSGSQPEVDLRTVTSTRPLATVTGPQPPGERAPTPAAEVVWIVSVGEPPNASVSVALAEIGCDASPEAVETLSFGADKMGRISCAHR